MVAPVSAADPPARLQVLVVRLDDTRLALPLEDVVEILPAMAVSPLPNTPAVIAGVVNRRGGPLPLIDLRTRLGLGARPADPGDHVVVCQVGSRTVGVWLDRAVELAEVDTGDLVPVTEIGAASHLEGVAMLTCGLLLVCDVRSFLAADEALALDAALAGTARGRRS